jgi:hypothetical protein
MVRVEAALRTPAWSPIVSSFVGGNDTKLSSIFRNARPDSTMHPLLTAIRDTPHLFLPEPSLRSYMRFQEGYSHRFAMEGRRVMWPYDFRQFHKWLCDRFQLKYAEAIAGTT